VKAITNIILDGMPEVEKSTFDSCWQSDEDFLSVTEFSFKNACRKASMRGCAESAFLDLVNLKRVTFLIA
jgi:hypothetical protein